MSGGGRLQIVCEECTFREVAESADGRPGNIVLTHGRDTGHKLSVSRL